MFTVHLLSQRKKLFIKIFDLLSVLCGYSQHFVLREDCFHRFDIGLFQIDLICSDQYGDILLLQVSYDRDIDLRIRVFGSIKYDHYRIHVVQPFNGIDDPFGSFLRPFLASGFFSPF